MIILKLRWRLSVLAWWLWLKVTPECRVKAGILQAVVDLRAKYLKEPSQ